MYGSLVAWVLGRWFVDFRHWILSRWFVDFRHWILSRWFVDFRHWILSRWFKCSYFRRVHCKGLCWPIQVRRVGTKGNIFHCLVD